jgi:hypothetical protein
MPFGSPMGSEFHDPYGMDGVDADWRPQLMDVAGNPLDEAKARDILQLRSMLSNMGAAVGATAAKLHAVREGVPGAGFAPGSIPPGMGLAPDGSLVPLGGRGASEYRTVHIDLASLPVWSGSARVKQQSKGLMRRRFWAKRFLRLDETGSLNIFESESAVDPEDFFQLGSSTSLEVQPASDHRSADVKFPVRIVDAFGKVCLMSFEEEEERDAWVAAIGAVVNLSQEVEHHNNQVSQGAVGYEGAAPAAMSDEERAAYEEEQRAMEAERRANIQEFALRHVAYGPGITHGTRGEQSEFVIELRDEAGDPDPMNFQSRDLRAVFESESLQLQLELRIEDTGDGRAVCTYTPPQTGSYVLAVTLDNEHIYGSPFDIDVDPAPTAPAHCVLDGEGIHTARVGVTNTITIIARDQFDEQRVDGGDQWSVDVDGPARVLDIIDNGGGEYTLQYQVDMEHEDMLKGGRHLPGIELRVYLVDPRYAGLTVDPTRPYRRPLKGMPICPVIVLEDGGSMAGARLMASRVSTRTDGTTPMRPLGPLASTPAKAFPGLAADEGGAASTMLRSRVHDLESESHELRDARDDAEARARSAERSLEEADRRVTDLESRIRRADARAEAAEKRAELAEAAAREAAANNTRAQAILTQLNEQSTKLQAFAMQLAERERALEAREGSGAPVAASSRQDTASKHTPSASLTGTGSVTGGTASLTGTADTGPMGMGPASLVSGAMGGGNLASAYGGVSTTSDRGSTLSASDKVTLSEGAPEELFAEDVMSLFASRRPVLFDLHKHYSKGSGKISANSFVRMFKDYDVIPTFIDAKRTRAVFAEVATAHGAEPDPADPKKVRIPFGAFVEAIGRIALVTLGQPTFRSLYPTAREKVEVVLETWSLGIREKLEEIKAYESRRGKRSSKKKKANMTDDEDEG